MLNRAALDASQQQINVITCVQIRTCLPRKAHKKQEVESHELPTRRHSGVVAPNGSGAQRNRPCAKNPE